MGFEMAIQWLVLYAISGIALLGLIVWSVLRADDRARMIFKWALTLGVLGVMVFMVAPIVGRGGLTGAFVGVPFAAVCGVVLAIIWAPNLAELFSAPFGSLFDGGKTPPDPRPAYSIAMARQKTGKYQEAVEEVQRQLQVFPTDPEGHLLLAAIQAEDLRDLEAAETTIMHFCSQPGHGPKNLVYALYSLADWHLAIGQDRAGAERALRKVIELLPGTEFELGAAQRIAHLGEPDAPLHNEHDRKFFVTEGVKNLGLVRQEALLGTEAEDKNLLAQEYAHHLENYPQDVEVREKLAMLYLDHYGRLDLAQLQLEEIINTPNQPQRVVAHCLNLMADLQVRAGAGYETVKQTLERIVELYPSFAPAETARRRLSLLKLELKARGAQTPVRMGDYEQNIGLKHARKKPGQD
jgi:tetratricopeptide (TPR) repeat protein